MFARLTKASLKANHAADFSKTFDEKIIPMLRKEKGFQDVILLAGTNGNEVVSITLWDIKENAEAYNTASYPEVLKVLANLIEGTPHVKIFEVSNSTITKFAMHAAV
jgi:heme-degrading monooxygenase HmoA